MVLGIYAYFDKKDNSIVYIGKDSHIDKSRRHKQHLQRSMYNSQPFNSVLQKNPNKYTYQVLVWDAKNQEHLNSLEIHYINQLKPKFNFTLGGDGSTGYNPTMETRRKLSEAGKNRKHSLETRKKMSESMKNFYENNPDARIKKSEARKGENHPMYGKRGKNNPCWKKYARVIKRGFTHNGEQKYGLIYEGKLLKESIHKKKLQRLADEINNNQRE